MSDVIVYDGDDPVEFTVTVAELDDLKAFDLVEHCDCEDDCPVWYGRDGCLTRIQQALGRAEG